MATYVARRKSDGFYWHSTPLGAGSWHATLEGASRFNQHWYNNGGKTFVGEWEAVDEIQALFEEGAKRHAKKVS
jgi:antirestriction protein